jgi:hypothetical protein
MSINFNSISINNNEIGNCLYKDNNNLLVSIVEHIENNNEGINEIEDKEEIMDFFEFDNEKKISKENIIWEDNYYDIWNPNISDIEEVNNGIESNNKENKDEGNEKKCKLKVNLLKSKTSNNSFNYKANKKLSVSQMKSMGSTNSSSVINCDNDNNKFKSNILNHSKEKKKNCSSKVIHVKTKQLNDKIKKKKNNNSVVINRSIESKSKNFINELMHNQNKIFQSLNNSTVFNINRSKKNLNNYFINKVCSSSFNNNNSNLNNNINISNNSKSNLKYKKNFSKKFDIFEKNKIKESTAKNKNSYRKINNFNVTVKSHYYNNSSYNYMNKTMGESSKRMSNISTSTSINGGTKIVSSKILFKRNNNPKINFINNNYQKPPQNSCNSKKMKLSYYSINKTNDKTPIDKIRKKISEIKKLINSNKNCKQNNYHAHNKLNSSLCKMSANAKNRKMKNKFDMPLNYYSNNTNNNNNKLRMSFEIKNNINNKNRKLFLSTSFHIKPKTKINERNSFKKFK